MKKCPFCAEDIRNAAVLCRYCGRELPAATTPDRSIAPKPSPRLPPVASMNTSKKLAAAALALFVTSSFGIVLYGKLMKKSPAPLGSWPIPQPTATAAVVLEEAPQANKSNVVVKLFDEELIDNPVQAVVVQHVIVSGDITNAGLREALDGLHRKALERRDFRHHEKTLGVRIHAYTSEDHARSGMGQWVAMLMDSPSDPPKITVRDDLVAALGQPPVVKFGLTEEERREIFAEIVRAEDRANREAERRYPDPDPLSPGWTIEKTNRAANSRDALVQKLEDQYRSEVARKYGLSAARLLEISGEGLQKNWPIPEAQ